MLCSYEFSLWKQLFLFFLLEEIIFLFYFANKGPSSQNYGFSSSHLWMWELDHNEDWSAKNWCFHIVVLFKSPLDC